VQRGHAVTIQTWRKWKADAESAGMVFAAAPEYQVFPTRERPLKPYEAAVIAARETMPLVRDGRFDVCVSDILTLAPALAAETCGVPVATLVPHLYPDNVSGNPPWSLGARAPRTALGARMWRMTDGLVRKGLEHGRRDYNDARAALDLPPRDELHTGLSRSLTMVATIPQLEYPRDWPSWIRITGPLIWEPPGEEVLPPPGDGPVVLVAPSTSQDPDHTLLRAALAGLAGESVRVMATWNGREPEKPLPQPPNAVLAPWLSYTRTMPHCDLVITHAGHGTVVRALTLGRPILACPVAGDMGENAARIAWAGLGTRLPRRLLSPAAIRIATRRVLTDPAIRARAEAVALWAETHDGAQSAALEVEGWAAALSSFGSTEARRGRASGG
jgi:UDP:flavonoid glycosyltransferase YjiC (YdhE family)